jgi:hypothetical protein
MNGNLGRQDTHWKELLEDYEWLGPELDRDYLLAALQAQDIDCVYFYCHARGGVADPETKRPYLEFQKSDKDPVRRIEPTNLEGPLWNHNPLVFLNACGTLGYSPDALSPFLKALVDGRQAAGVLGTEVAVAEMLASDVGRAFIRKFLKEGMCAGKALLEIRQWLLAGYNPLGLVYTLFAPAELAVDLDGDGKCG